MAAERLVVVEIADLKVVNDPGAALITYALGSCVAVVVYDPTRRIAGMLHFMLPVSSVSPGKGREAPGMFADTGVPLLFEKLYAFGCRKPELIVKVAGGGSLQEGGDAFQIGPRNVAMLRYMFERTGVRVAAEDVGGRRSRTVKIAVATGLVTVRSGAEETTL